MLPGTYLRTHGITQKKWSQEPNSREEGKREVMQVVLYTQGVKRPPEAGRLILAGAQPTYNTENN